MLIKSDTIAAISTPLGEGGIGIVRLSGEKALKIADKLFKGRNGIPPSKLPHILFITVILSETKKFWMR